MRYVVGFAFDKSRQFVVLIRKERPAWQKGRLNGVGGKVERGEAPERAMWREFLEEAGQDVQPDLWLPVALIISGDAQIEFFSHVFYADSDRLRKAFAASPTDEKLEVWPVKSIGELATAGLTIPNLAWLVPLAAHRHDTYERPVFLERPRAGQDMI